ncbi:MAG: PCRF domain-containing protein, partial [Pseudomonadales bacterium]|nr:PCRF domain-containing protein [Pseudomonadales bacterium]
MIALISFGGIFDYANKKEELTEVELELAEPAVWDDPDKAQQLGKQRAVLEGVVSIIDKLDAGIGDAKDLLELVIEDDDAEALESVDSEIAELESLLAKLEFRRM